MLLILIFSLAIGLALSDPENTIALLFKGYNVHPRSALQSVALKVFRDSDFNDKIFFSGGPIRVNREIKVWVSPVLNNDFLSSMRESNISYSLEFRKIKVKQYQALVQSNASADDTNVQRNSQRDYMQDSENGNQASVLMDRYPDHRCVTDSDCDIGKFCALKNTEKPLCGFLPPAPVPGTRYCYLQYPNLCLNGGICILTLVPRRVDCQCQYPWYGSRCENRQ